MPITGTFWSSKELQKLLGVSKQRVSDLARQLCWDSPISGLYRGGVAEDTTTVDAYIFARNRAIIHGYSQRPIWDDGCDVNCPVCGGFAIEWPDSEHYKCIQGHTGKLSGRE